MKLGIVISSGGAAFEQVASIVAQSKVEFVVITDRECGAEAVARKLGATIHRIEEPNRAIFSRKVADFCRSSHIRSVLLFFHRLVSEELFQTISTSNIHPAALPAFKGLKGVEDAHASAVRVLGCTLHKVNEDVDGGAIISQIARGVDPAWPLARWQKIAFLMKVYCGLVWVAGEMQLQPLSNPINASHGLPDEWRTSFLELQAAEGEVIIEPDHRYVLQQ
jgi:phosphoribosylglycinamide formyltransferase 1